MERERDVRTVFWVEVVEGGRGGHGALLLGELLARLDGCATSTYGFDVSGCQEE